MSVEGSTLTLSPPGVFLRMCSRGPEIHLCFLQNFAVIQQMVIFDFPSRFWCHSNHLSKKNFLGTKPFKKYPLIFSQPSCLKNHKRTHSGNKAHPCKLCPKTIYVPGSLKKHQTTHSVEKPYLCKQCPKTFSSS